MKICVDSINRDLTKWLKHYIAFLKRENFADNTIEVYQRVCYDFILYASNIDIDCIVELRRDHIEDFFLYMEERYAKKSYRPYFRYATKTRRLYFIILKLFLEYISDNTSLYNGIQVDFSDLFKKEKTRKGRKKDTKELKYIVPEDVNKLTYFLDEWTEKKSYSSYLYSLAIKIMLFGGLRASEVLNLTFDDVIILKSEGKRGDIMELKIRESKSGSIQYVPILYSHIKKEFEWISKSKKGKGFVISKKNNNKIDRSNLYRSVNNIFKKAGLNYKGLHILRHTSAMMILEKTGDVTVAKELLRHASVNTTMIYVHRSSTGIIDKIV